MLVTSTDHKLRLWLGSLAALAANEERHRSSFV
jgi:hypothetical protein